MRCSQYRRDVPGSGDYCTAPSDKRSLLWAEWLKQEVLEPVPHRHVVVTMPRLLRPLFRRRRELLRDLAQCASDAVAAFVHDGLGKDVRAGIVVSIATAGDLVQWHPHLHILATDGGFSADGSFQPLERWNGEVLMRLFRAALLERLVSKHAISQELQAKLLAWRHPGFSSHVGQPIPPEDTHAIEDMASYVVRLPEALRMKAIEGELHRLCTTVLHGDVEPPAVLYLFFADDSQYRQACPAINLFSWTAPAKVSAEKVQNAKRYGCGVPHESPLLDKHRSGRASRQLLLPPRTPTRPPTSASLVRGDFV